MQANESKSELTLIDEAITWLRERLPPGWEVNRSSREIRIGSQPPEMVDSLIALQAPNGTFATLAVEARQSFTPRDATTLLPRLAQLVRSIVGGVNLLVVAPWLSSRSQTLLAQQGINYLDTTGNALLRLDNPALYIEADGASRNPMPQERGRAQLTGPKAARLIRLLVDVQPPYGVSQVADASGLAPGYVSRLLDTLFRDALVERSGRGRVESVDVSGLLRRWARTYEVFKANETYGYVAPGGIDDFLERLVMDAGPENRIAFTGSLAATRLAPLTAPAMAIGYCDDPATIAQELNLLSAEDGASVALLKPFDPVVWQRNQFEAGLRFVAPSQVAIDCLTGNGRMPNEGEAVLGWMRENEASWRLPSLADLSERADEPH
jgi:hypothetical protein